MRLFVDDEGNDGWVHWPAEQKENEMLHWVKNDLKDKKFVVLEFGAGTYDPRVKVIKTSMINYRLPIIKI